MGHGPEELGGAIAQRDRFSSVQEGRCQGTKELEDTMAHQLRGEAPQQGGGSSSPAARRREPHLWRYAVRIPIRTLHPGPDHGGQNHVGDGGLLETGKQRAGGSNPGPTLGHRAGVPVSTAFASGKDFWRGWGYRCACGTYCGGSTD